MEHVPYNLGLFKGFGDSVVLGFQTSEAHKIAHWEN